MSLIDQATKRLEELSRAGVAVPWSSAGLANSSLKSAVEARELAAAQPGPVPVAHLAPREQAANSQEIPSAVSFDSDGVVSGREVSIDLERLELAGHLVPRQTRSRLAEEFRQIKRPLLKNARSKDAAANRLSLIMVTSALPGEGKTFSAINLAISIATEIDLSVLLVDADVVRPDVLNRLGIDADKGLLDLLTDTTLSMQDVVLRTNVPKLSILPAGNRNNLSTELLASEAMKRVLVTLATRHKDQVVIFDAPPLLVTSEAKVLATRVGQVVLVIAAGSTKREAVAQAFGALEQCPNVMSLLNKAREPDVPGGGYGYYG